MAETYEHLEQRCKRAEVRVAKLENKLKEAQPFMEAVKKRHNGYDPEFCKAVKCNPPDTPEEALQELWDEYDRAEDAYIKTIVRLTGRIEELEATTYRIAELEATIAVNEDIISELNEENDKLEKYTPVSKTLVPSLNARIAELEKDIDLWRNEQIRCENMAKEFEAEVKRLNEQNDKLRMDVSQWFRHCRFLEARYKVRVVDEGINNGKLKANCRSNG